MLDAARPLSIVLLALAAGCGSPGADAGAPAPGSGGPDAAADGPCASPAADAAPGATCLVAARGRVTDLDGAPLGAMVVSVCGAVCYGGITAADGTFDIVVGDLVDLEKFAFIVHGLPDHASLYTRLSRTTATELVFADPVRIPRLPSDGAPLPASDAPASSVTAGEVTLQIPDATKITLDLDAFALGAEGRLFRSIAVAPGDFPPFAQGTGIAALYALAPFATKTSKPLGLSVPNTGALPAGSAVELLALSDDVYDDPFVGGTAVVVATGAVSADGATITTDPGAGLSELTWVGLRPKGK